MEVKGAVLLDRAHESVARARALLADDDAAEPEYRQVIEYLQQSLVAPELARTHLLFGEWLRRQRRRKGGS